MTLASGTLGRLNAQVPIVDSKGQPTPQFQLLWQRNCEAIEAAYTDLANNVAAIAAAQSAADDAQTDATAAARELARLNSYTVPTVALSAADVGATATITIANHDRIYPVQGSIDVPDLAIIGGTLTGKAFSTDYWIYYDDTTLADTTPNFVATTDVEAAQVGAAAGRHFVGKITTPADGAGATGGTGGYPPGGGGGSVIP